MVCPLVRPALKHFCLLLPFCVCSILAFGSAIPSVVGPFCLTPRFPSCSVGCVTNEMLKSNPLTGDSFSCFLWDLACQFVLGPAPIQQLCICHVLGECSADPSAREWSRETNQQTESAREREHDRERMPRQPASQTKQGTQMIDSPHLLRSFPPHHPLC